MKVWEEEKAKENCIIILATHSSPSWKLRELHVLHWKARPNSLIFDRSSAEIENIGKRRKKKKNFRKKVSYCTIMGTHLGKKNCSEKEIATS